MVVLFQFIFKKALKNAVQTYPATFYCESGSYQF